MLSGTLDTSLLGNTIFPLICAKPQISTTL